jgi:hypothetical protein
MNHVHGTAVFLVAIGVAAWGAAPSRDGWSAPVEVRHDETLCLTYQAKLDGPFLVVRANIEPGWHTFAMDNKVRAEEKLAGKPSLGIDRPTEISVTEAMQISAPWYQTAPQDFSKPELRWFSWGFEKQAMFAARVRRPASGTIQIAISGQACTDTICRNIDVSIPLPSGSTQGTSSIQLKDLVKVR